MINLLAAIGANQQILSLPNIEYWGILPILILASGQ